MDGDEQLDLGELHANTQHVLDDAVPDDPQSRLADLPKAVKTGQYIAPSSARFRRWNAKSARTC